MRIENLKRTLLGIGEYIPEGVMYGSEINANMLTMIGYKRLSNVEQLIKYVVETGVDGDVIETGVWRGGACILMREHLNELKSDKKVYVADSFEGLPKPDGKYPHDEGDTHHQVGMLSVSMEDVMVNFKTYSTLENVVFLKGWFKDTLPTLKNKFSLIRLDGDMYSSTIDALNNLYPLLSKNGCCIIDDYWAVNGCRQAVIDYRKEHKITEKIIQIDKTGIYWQKLKQCLHKKK